MQYQSGAWYAEAAIKFEKKYQNFKILKSSVAGGRGEISNRQSRQSRQCRQTVKAFLKKLLDLSQLHMKGFYGF